MPGNKEGRIGARKPKLNYAQLKEIIQLHENGKSATELAELFNVHKATVHRVFKKSDFDLLLYSLK